jgi:hypothetical protein
MENDAPLSASGDYLGLLLVIESPQEALCQSPSILA